MNQNYHVEITQQQTLFVSICADSKEEAIERVHSQQGEVVCLLPPEILLEKTKVVRCQADGE